MDSKKSPIPISSLAQPITLVQVKTRTVDGSPAIITLSADSSGKLSISAEAPPSVEAPPEN